MSKNEKYGWRHKKAVVSLTGLFVLISPIAYAAGSDSALDNVTGGEESAVLSAAAEAEA